MSKEKKSTATADKRPRVWECSIEYDDYTHREQIVAETRSKAKYAFFLSHLSWCYSFHECYGFARCRLVGELDPCHFFDSRGFDNMKTNRGIEFAFIGMAISVNGKRGVIVGSNGSLNLNVYFDGVIHNCHPHWKTVYYDNMGIVIKSFMEAS